MNKQQKPKSYALEVDEYGRTSLFDDEILELVTGANLSFLYGGGGGESCNNGCGSNSACINSGCS